MFFFLLCLADGGEGGKNNGGDIFSDFFLHSHDVFKGNQKKENTKKNTEEKEGKIKSC